MGAYSLAQAQAQEQLDRLIDEALSVMLRTLTQGTVNRASSPVA